MSSRTACKPRVAHYFSFKTSDQLTDHLGLSPLIAEGSDLELSSSSPTNKLISKSAKFSSNRLAQTAGSNSRTSIPSGILTSQNVCTPKSCSSLYTKLTLSNSNRAPITPKRIIVKSQSPASGDTGNNTPKGSDVIKAFSQTGSGKKLKIRPIIRCRSATKIETPELKVSRSSILKVLSSSPSRDSLDKLEETSFNFNTSYGSLARGLDTSTSFSSNPTNLSSYVSPTKPSHSRQGSFLENLLEKGPMKEGDRTFKDHIEQTFESMKFVRALKPLDVAQIKQKKIKLAKRPGYENKKTVIFDLDETLVHCCESVDCNPDVILPIKFPSGEVVKAGVNIRPYCREVLREANKDYEVIVFTASHRCYADVVLNYLDPTGELIHHRLYRDNCLVSDGIFIKDLRILNRRLSDVVIVDNAAYSFAYQMDNGIPIISWYDDKNDIELQNLISYLRTLVKQEDIRELNRKTFKLKTFYEDYRDKFNTLDPTPSATSPTTNIQETNRKTLTLKTFYEDYKDKFSCVDSPPLAPSPTAATTKKVKAVPCRVIRKYFS